MVYQLIYISTVSPRATVDMRQILRASQINNAKAGITGLLFYNGRRFLQALEGERQPVADALAHIRADPRHRALVTLSERTIEHREFGHWAMADATAAADPAGVLLQIERLVTSASPAVQATFASYARLKLAA